MKTFKDYLKESVKYDEDLARQMADKDYNVTKFSKHHTGKIVVHVNNLNGMEDKEKAQRHLNKITGLPELSHLSKSAGGEGQTNTHIVVFDKSHIPTKKITLGPSDADRNQANKRGWTND